MAKLGVVLFFKRNNEGTFDCYGRTKIVPLKKALNIYAEYPNPASQLIEGNDEHEVKVNAVKMIQNMKNKQYVEEMIVPFI